MKRAACALMALVVATAVQAVVYTLPTGSWPGTNNDNPTGPWSAKLQAPGAGYTDSYLAAPLTYFASTGSTWFGQDFNAGINVSGQTATILTWPGSKLGVIEFTVPAVSATQIATITGTTRMADPTCWNHIQIYKLNADGTVAQVLGSYSMNAVSPNPSRFDFNLNCEVSTGDRILYRSASAYNYCFNYLENYSITLTLAPPPKTISLVVNSKDSAGTYSAATSYVWDVSGDLDWMLASQGNETNFGHEFYRATMNPGGQYFQVGTPAYQGFDIGANLTSPLPQQAGAHDGSGENAHFYYGTGLTGYRVNSAYTDQTGYAGLIWFYNPSYQSTGMTYTFKAPASRFQLHHNFNLGSASPDQTTFSIKVNGLPVNIGTQSSVPFNGSDFPTNNYELINAVLTFDNLTAGDDVTITHVGTSIGWQGARLVADSGPVTPVTGDVNNDGLVDALDIDAVSAAIKAGSTDLKYDLNSDTVVTSADKDYLIHTILHTQYGDATLDKKVDVSDLGVLAANYGTTSGAIWSKGDFTGDGKVDVSDLGVLAANYGFVSGKAAQAMDIQQDMKALGLSIGQDDLKAAQEPAPTGSCGSAGFPLIAGVCLAAMLLLNGFRWRE